MKAPMKDLLWALYEGQRVRFQALLAAHIDEMIPEGVTMLENAIAARERDLRELR